MVLEKVKVILAEQFDIDEDSLQNDTDLQDDLGADSLDVVDLLMSIEDEFDIEIPDEEIENIRTVGELVNPNRPGPAIHVSGIAISHIGRRSAIVE